MRSTGGASSQGSSLRPRGPSSPGTSPREALARLGEAAARDALVRAGWQIVEQNARTRRGEIDLVAWDGDCLVFVEVKSRTGVRFGRPEEAVDERKRGRLRRLAEAFLAVRQLRPVRCRFDVITVMERPGGAPELRHIRDAF